MMFHVASIMCETEKACIVCIMFYEVRENSIPSAFTTGKRIVRRID